MNDITKAKETGTPSCAAVCEPPVVYEASELMCRRDANVRLRLLLLRNTDPVRLLVEELDEANKSSKAIYSSVSSSTALSDFKHARVISRVTPDFTVHVMGDDSV